MRKLPALFPVLALLAGGGMAQAQAPDGAAHRAGIDRLAFMIGTWQGEAWMQRGRDRVRTTMTEKVERMLGGAVLEVEGQGIIPASEGSDARVVHHALGIITFDPAAGSYGLRSYLATGQSGDFVLEVIPGGVRWSREVPGGRVRNTAHIADGTWHEVGEFSRDGETWTQIMEMRLQREP